MLNTAQPYVLPSNNSYYLGTGNLRQVSQVLDTNQDGVVAGRAGDEVQMSAQLLRRIDSNQDGLVQTSEFSNALSHRQLSLQNLDKGSAQAIASLLMDEDVISEAFGNVGRTLDTDRNGYVTGRELSTALQRGTVGISGPYLVALNGTGHTPWNEFANLRSEIEAINSQKMKQDQWGNYDPNTGLFTAEQANKKVLDLVNTKLLPSTTIRLSDKLDLLKSLIMKTDQWGNNLPATGSLTASQAQSLAQQVLSQADDAIDKGYDAQKLVETLRSVQMKKDQWGNDISGSGLLTRTQCNARIKSFIENQVVSSTRLNVADKLALIRSEQMKRDQWGNDNPATGSLSASQANSLAQKALAQPEDPICGMYDAQKFIETLRNLKMQKDQWGNENSATGLLTQSQCNARIKAFIKNQVMSSPSLNVADKLVLIRSEQMKRDQWGNEDASTGSLTSREAQDLAREVL